jgi:hypothetical protein
VVSFFDYDSVQIIPGFSADQLQRRAVSEVTWRTYLSTIRFAVIVWAVTLFIGFWVAYVSGVPCAQPHGADRAVPGLHGSVPDLQHHPHDLLDSVPRP